VPDEVPRKKLLFDAFTVDIKIGIYVACAKCLAPFAAIPCLYNYKYPNFTFSDTLDVIIALFIFFKRRKYSAALIKRIEVLHLRHG
jgi:hypothetical protein